MAKHTQIILDSLKIGGAGSRKIKMTYKPNKMFDNRISAENREKAKTMFEIAQDELGGLNFDVNIFTRKLVEDAAKILGETVFDINKSTADMMTAVEESGIRFGSNKFLKTVF